MSAAGTPAVERIGEAHGARWQALSLLLEPLGLEIRHCEPDRPIPGSYWGGDEAGLTGHTLWLRSATPLHSALHEACHYLCMDERRRDALDTDAGGDDIEECAVCYLSIVLSDALPEFGRSRMLDDMDAWGYSFRLGSARAWFERDAADARAWLIEHGIADATLRLPGTRRTARSGVRHEPSISARIAR